MIKPKRTSNRDVVLRIAAALFLERGYQVTSMDDIVAASKVSKTNIYYHFKSKEELLSAILEQLIEHYDRLIGDVIAQTQLPVMERLGRFAALLAENQSDSLGGCPFLTLYVQTSHEHAWVRERIGVFFRKQIGTLENLLQQGIDKGELKPDLPAARTAAMIVSTIEGALFLQHTGQEGDILQNIIHTLAFLLK